MAARKSPQHGYQLSTHGLIGQVKALVEIGDETNGLVSSAGRLAEHEPRLGTAPPAQHLAMRLRDAAGPAGLTGEVTAADAELTSYHKALRATVNRYQDGDQDVAWRLSDDGTVT